MPASQSRKMKVLYLIPGLSMGGAEKCTLEIVRHLDKTRYEPVIYLLNKVPLFFKDLLKRNSIRIVEDESWMETGDDKLLDFILEEGIDLVHYQFCGDGNGIYPKYREIVGTITSLGVPVIETVRLLDKGNEKSSISYCVSDAVKRLQAGNPKALTLYEGVDLDLYKSDPRARSDIRKEIGIPARNKVIGYAGRITRTKGIFDLIHLFREIRRKRDDATLCFIGQGDDYDELKSISDKEKDIMVLGPKEDIHAYLNLFDIFFHPSLYDAFPTSILEAMATGIPVIAYDIGGMAELPAADGACILLDPGDIVSSIEVVGKLLDSKPLRDDMGRKARLAASRKYDIRKSVRLMEESYEHVVQANPAPLVSIIMPAYNSAGFVSEAIDSVLSQTYINWELIIVDDGSTDRTHDIASRYAAKHPRVKVFRNASNKGIPASRNIGLRAARGRFVGHLDSDDILDPAALKMCVDVLVKDRAIKFLYTDYLNVDASNDEVLSHMSTPDSFDEFNAPAWHHFGIYDRQIAISLGGYNEFFDVCDDGYLAISIAEKHKTYHLGTPLYRRRIHGSNSSFRIVAGCKECAKARHCPYLRKFEAHIKKHRKR